MKHTKKALPVTIVIPAYNEEKNIVACLESIENQEVMPDRVIVVNNNSSDETVALTSQFRFVEILHEKRQGIAYTRNRGFDAVKSGIIARIDADTTLPTTWVGDIKRFFQNSQHDGSALTGSGYFSNLIFPPRAVSKAVQSLIAFRFNRIIMGHYILWGSNMAMHARHWRQVRNDICNDTDIHEDLDLAIHLKRMGVDIVYDPQLSVGVVMKRVLDNWKSLYANLMWWPRTLQRHNNKRWMLGLAGAYFLLVTSSLLVVFNKPIMIMQKTREYRLLYRFGKLLD